MLGDDFSSSYFSPSKVASEAVLSDLAERAMPDKRGEGGQIKALCALFKV